VEQFYDRLKSMLAEQECYGCRKPGTQVDWVLIRVEKHGVNGMQASAVFGCRQCHESDLRAATSNAKREIQKVEETLEHELKRIRELSEALAR